MPDAKTNQITQNTAYQIATHAGSTTTRYESHAEKQKEEAIVASAVRANPEAAKIAVQDIKSGAIPIEGDAGMFGDKDKAIALIQNELKSAGVGGGRDVQPHEVRNGAPAAAVANPKQVGGR